MKIPLWTNHLSPTFTRASRRGLLSIVATLIASQFSVRAVTQTRAGWVEDGAGVDYWFEYTETLGKDFGDIWHTIYIGRNCKDVAIPWSFDLTFTHQVVMQPGWSSLSNIGRTVPIPPVVVKQKESGTLQPHSEIRYEYRWLGDYLESGKVQTWNENRTVLLNETTLAAGYWNYDMDVVSRERLIKCPESGSTAGLLLMGAAICGGGNLLRRRDTSGAESAA